MRYSRIGVLVVGVALMGMNLSGCRKDIQSKKQTAVIMTEISEEGIKGIRGKICHSLDASREEDIIEDGRIVGKRVIGGPKTKRCDESLEWQRDDLDKVQNGEFYFPLDDRLYYLTNISKDKKSLSLKMSIVRFSWNLYDNGLTEANVSLSLSFCEEVRELRSCGPRSWKKEFSYVKLQRLRKTTDNPSELLIVKFLRP